MHQSLTSCSHVILMNSMVITHKPLWGSFPTMLSCADYDTNSTELATILDAFGKRNPELVLCINKLDAHFLDIISSVFLSLSGITRFSFENHHSGLVKLVGTSGSKTIWVGRNEALYSITPAQDFKPKLVFYMKQ